MFSISYFSLINNFCSGLFIILIFFLFTHCDIKKNEIKPESSFAKIYNNEKIEGSFYPIDLKQTSDGGFLVLAAANLWDTYLLKINSKGEQEWDTTITSIVNPIGDLSISNNGSLRFFGMDKLSRQITLLEISQDKNLNELKRFSFTTTALSSSPTPNGGYLLLSYNYDKGKTFFHIISPVFETIYEQEYDPLEDVTDKIDAHVYRRGISYPFFTGTILNGNTTVGYYVNVFYEYRIALQFIDAGGLPAGKLDGYSYRGGLSSFLPLANNQFALSRFAFEENFFTPNVPINIEDIQSVSKLNGKQIYDISAYAKVVLKKAIIGGRDILIYGSTTKNNRIILYFYTPTGEYLGQKYLGAVFPYELFNFIHTNDGGLAILGKTFVAGRFPRVCLFKLSSEEIGGILK